MDKEVKLRVIDIIVSILIMFVTIAVICNNRLSGMIDTIFLPEERNKGYYDILNNPSRMYESSDLYENGTNNLLANYLSSGDRDEGYSIAVNTDGSFLFSGRYLGDNDAYEQIVPIEAGLDLPSGDYILSDGGASSEDGVYVRLMCKKRMIGGRTEVVSIASLPGNALFHWDRDPNLELYCEIVIRPGASADNLKFCPMLLKTEIDDYQPCLAYNYEWVGNRTEGGVKFYKYDINRFFLSEELVNHDDWNILLNSFKYQMQADKAVIDLRDGYGIEIQKKDYPVATYGKLNASLTLSDGEEINIADYKETLRIIRPSRNLSLREIRNIESYLKVLEENDYTILIAINDEGVLALNRKIMEILYRLGMETNLVDYEGDYSGSRKFYRNSFYSVLKQGKSEAEKISEEKLVLTGTLSDGADYVIESSGLITGEAKASIKICGEEYAMNLRGMNFVIYDEEHHFVVDSVCFDTCSGLLCHRRAKR